MTRRPIKVLTLCTALALGCDDATAPGFGTQYKVLLEPAPSLDGASLSVTVSYGGCGAGHEFELQHKARASTVDVWLRKLDQEPCDALFTERLTFNVPAAVRDAPSVHLLSPNEDPFRLRP